MGKLIKICVDGSKIEVPAKKADYETITGLIGGYLERVRVRYEGKMRDAYVDEEGVLKGLPANQAITNMLDGPFKNYSGFIVGTAVIWVP